MKSKKISAAVDELLGKAYEVVDRMLSELPDSSIASFIKINDARMEAEPFTRIEKAYEAEAEVFNQIKDGEEYAHAMNGLNEDRAEAYSLVRLDRDAAKRLLDDAAMKMMASNHRYASVLDSMPDYARDSVLRSFWLIADEQRSSGFKVVARRFLDVLDFAYECVSQISTREFAIDKKDSRANPSEKKKARQKQGQGR